MASSWALQEWCRVTCADYPSVEIKDLSSSFRDGLAFCAIIHKHRPDLINFSCLSRVNAHQNNKLAFEVAETKLGIPALLDPNDVVSCKVPDCLSIISYVFQYYSFFSSRHNAGPASLASLHITEYNHAKTKGPDGLKLLKSSSHLKASKVQLCSTNPQTVCKLCFKPVHLIQRLLADGEIYHRSCFRCSVCHCSLLPEFYTPGDDAGSLVCVHHAINSKSVRSAHNEPRCKFQPSFVSLSGLAVSSIPHYTMKTESQDKPVHESAKTERQEKIREEKDSKSCTAGLRSRVKMPAPLHLPSSCGKDGTAEGAEHDAAETKWSSGLSEPSQATGGSGRPVPAPRRMVDSASAPVPAPRVKTSQMSSRPVAGDATSQCKPPPFSPHSQTSANPKVKTSHPWLGIIHPGPWTQLPPAPPPVAPPRSRSLSTLQGPWYRPRVAPLNPFGEEVESETSEEAAKCDPADQTEEDAVCSGDAENTDNKSDYKAEALDKPVPPKRQGRANTVQTSGEFAGCVTQDLLPRSVSVPTIASAHYQSSLEPCGLTDTVTSNQSKQVWKDDACNPNPSMSKSRTSQALPSQRAPGHGFPLIKRKVQTDQTVPTGDLQVEMGELNKQLEALEQRGVELERNLRDSKSSSQKEEEQMLMEWFTLIHKRHVLVRRDTELVYLRKQQDLEEKQADVEYNLRCLLNKPESDWTKEDRNQEQQLMDELVGIIEQRNQIVSSLDQDRQREKTDDVLWETTMKNKELQKEGLKEIKKSKGKSKPLNVFKKLSHKADVVKKS